MSDIQSIANGTYIIGETSATNFIAGNGIKIDSPSAGTVRIGTDETVLFDSSAGVQVNNRSTSAQLSESVYNFERVRIYDDWLNATPAKCTEFDTHNTSQSGLNRFGTYHASIDGWNFESSPSMYLAANFYSLHNNGTLIRTERNYIWGKLVGGFTSAYQTQERNGSKLYRVVGINRISGSNA